MQAADYVLIVDDEGGIRRVFSSILEDEGYAVQTAENGCDALELVALQPPRLILLDLVMPEMDGCEFVKQYRQSAGPHAPIILITAVTDSDSAVRSADADGYVQKPFDIDELLTVVAQHMGPPAGA